MKKYILTFLFLLLLVLFFAEKPKNPNHNDPPGSEQNLENQIAEQILNEQVGAVFWKKRLDAVKSSEFRLVLDLSADSLYLEIKSIILHAARIERNMANDSLHLLRISPAVIPWLSRPFFLKEEWSSVNKQPVRVKDISHWGEFSENLDFTPVDIDTNEVCVVLRFSNDLGIALLQQEPRADNNPLLSHFAPEGDEEGDVILDQQPYTDVQNKYFLWIEIPRKDLLAIFRALPAGAELIFRP